MACSGLKATFVAALLLSSLASQANATPTAVVVWNRAALTEVRLTRQGPPIAARALAVAHTCMYDAWAPYDTRAIASVATTIPRRPGAEANDANKTRAVSVAAYRCLSNLYPAGAARLEAVLRSQGFDPLDQSTNLATPQGIGNAAAAAVIAKYRTIAQSKAEILTGLLTKLSTLSHSIRTLPPHVVPTEASSQLKFAFWLR